MEEDDDLHLARLSIDDLNQIALEWRLRALQGDKTVSAIAEAMETVVRQRRSVALARERVLTARRAWAPLRKAAEWAVSRR
jgi:hypothetical protein